MQTFFNGRLILPHVLVLAIAGDGRANGKDESATVLVKRDGPHQPFVTARIWWHNTPEGRTVREWDHGHYFDDLMAAREDFAERAGFRGPDNAISGSALDRRRA
jgi:hypothetical protein